MKTMRERLARIIDPRAWSPRVTRGPAKEYRQESALRRADLILDELRTPDEGMVDQGNRQFTCLDMWTVMIDHARHPGEWT